MKKADMAFSAGKFEEAKGAYLQAFTMDPKLYVAAVGIGEINFRKGDFAAAQDWYARATEIDPMEETAYRYWGDALLKQGRIPLPERSSSMQSSVILTISDHGTV